MTIRSLEDGISIDILVQPRASRERFGPVHGDRIKLAVTAAPVDGAANDAVIKALSRIFGCARSKVTITRGHSSRRKTVQILGIAADIAQGQIHD